jgi:hypothetical protein
MPDIDYQTGLEWYGRTLAAISNARARALALAGLGGDEEQLAALAAADRGRTIAKRIATIRRANKAASIRRGNAIAQRMKINRAAAQRSRNVVRTNKPRSAGFRRGVAALAPVTAGTAAASQRVNDYLAQLQIKTDPKRFRRIKARVLAALNEAGAGSGRGTSRGQSGAPGGGRADSNRGNGLTEPGDPSNGAGIFYPSTAASGTSANNSASSTGHASAVGLPD